MSTNLPDMIERALNPALLGWPPMMPVELALREKTPAEVCAAYNISRTEWDALKENPAFVKAVDQAIADLKRDGMGFKVKARLQAEALLLKSWDMINASDDAVPPTVKADLIKFTIKAAGLDGSKDVGQGGPVGTALQININLG